MSATSPGKHMCSTDASASLRDPRMLLSQNSPWTRPDQESRELPPETRVGRSRVSGENSAKVRGLHGGSTNTC